MTAQPLQLDHAKPDHAYQAAFIAAQTLQQSGYEAFWVGGAVRDLLLRQQPKDYDIATSATPDQIQAIKGFSKAVFNDSSQAYGISRVRLPEWPEIEIEIATFRRDIDPHRGRKATTIAYADLPSDLTRRDFTINALAYDPCRQLLIDIVDGQADIAAKQIRFIGDPERRLTEDPLRLLRAIRLKNTLGFHYTEATMSAIRAAVKQGMVHTIAIDRIRQELTRMLIHPSRAQAMADCLSLGILQQLLPEVARGKGTAQPPQLHAEGDVWQHHMLALQALPEHPTSRLAWATLLHDVGKPPTQSFPTDTHDRIRFNRHYAVGADIAYRILNRLQFPHALRDDIVWMIAHHLNIDELPVMRPGRQRVMLDHPAFGDLLELHKADAAATWPKGGKPTHAPDFSTLEALWHHYQIELQHTPKPSLKRDLGIDGHWLQTTFATELQGTEPALIGTILAELETAFIDEHITEVDQLKMLAAKSIQLHRQTSS